MNVNRRLSDRFNPVVSHVKQTFDQAIGSGSESQRTGQDAAEYENMAEKMAELASRQPGCKFSPQDCNIC